MPIFLLLFLLSLFLPISANCHTLQANCVDSTAPPEAVFAKEIEKLKAAQFRPREQITLDPFERDHAVVIGTYRHKKKA